MYVYMYVAWGWILVSISEKSKPVETREVTLTQRVTCWTFIVKGLF